MLTKCCNILISTGFHNINYRTNELCGCVSTCCDSQTNLKTNKNMTNSLIGSVDAIKKLRLQEMEDNTTYSLLKSLNPTIQNTKSWYFYQKYHKKRVFLYYLSKELSVPNNLGLRRYVDEVIAK